MFIIEAGKDTEWSGEGMKVLQRVNTAGETGSGKCWRKDKGIHSSAVTAASHLTI